MYTQLWNKYLPIIKILLKRSLTQEQNLDLDMTDFDRAGISRKAGNKFNLVFNNGRLESIGISDLAKELAVLLLDDEKIKELFSQNIYHVSVNTKYKLSIKCMPGEAKPVYHNEEVAAF